MFSNKLDFITNLVVFLTMRRNSRKSNERILVNGPQDVNQNVVNKGNMAKKRPAKAVDGTSPVKEAAIKTKNSNVENEGKRRKIASQQVKSSVKRRIDFNDEIDESEKIKDSNNSNVSVDLNKVDLGSDVVQGQMKTKSMVLRDKTKKPEVNDLRSH